MPIDTSIPLQYKSPQFTTPQQLMSLRQMAQQLQMQNMQMDEYKRKTETQNALRTILSAPGASDENGVLKPETVNKVIGIDPATGLKLHADAQKQATDATTIKKNMAQTFEIMQKEKKDVMSTLGRVGEQAYDNAFTQESNPEKAATAATQAVRDSYDQLKTGGRISAEWQPDFEKLIAMPFNINNVRMMNQALRPMASDVAANKPDIAPKMRTRITGSNEIQEEWDASTNTWKPIGTGPRFARQVAPVVIQGEKLPAGYRWGAKDADGNPTLEPIKGGPADKGGFEGRNGEIMAAVVERGGALPAGFRSGAQQKGLLNAISRRYPDETPDQIADRVIKGKLDMTGLTKEVQIAGSQAGKIAYAENEIEQTIPLVREASAKLPRGQFVPYQRLKQMGEKEFSDPDLAEFKMYMTSLSNAYDLLAARGGTDMDKRRENRKNFNTAASPEALERVLQAVRKEAQASGRAAQDSMDISRNRRSTDNAGGKIVNFSDLK